MKLFIAGSDKIYAIENFYAKYLRQAGVEVFHFPAQTIFYDYYHKNILNKLVYRSGLSQVVSKLNKRFKKLVEEFRPDVIWVFKGMEILPGTLEWAKARGIFLVNSNGDSPFIFSGKGSGNKNVTASIPLYDLFLTYNANDKKRMETEVHVHSEILPFGFDLGEDLFDQLESIEEVSKVCFLGNPDDQRCKFLIHLADLGVTIDVYGHNWTQFVNHQNITAFEPVYEQEFWFTLRKYRVQLNLMRPHNLDSHNMRTFEAGGVGAIQLAPDTPDHRMFFKENEEIFLFNDVASCYGKIEQLLHLTPREAGEIRKSARRRSILNGYSYKGRSEQVLNILKTFAVRS